MKPTLYLKAALALVGVMGGLWVQATENGISEARSVPRFTSVWVSHNVVVELQQAASTRVVVEGQPADVATLRTDVESGMLRVFRMGGAKGSQGPVKVLIQTPHLTHLLVNESAQVTGVGTFREESLYIDAGGSASLAMVLDVSFVSLQLSGSAQVTLRGRSRQTHITGAGSSVAATAGLKSDEVVVVLRHRTKLETHAEQSLEAQLYDQTNLRYHGTPTNRQILQQGTPSVEELN